MSTCFSRVFISTESESEHIESAFGSSRSERASRSLRAGIAGVLKRVPEALLSAIRLLLSRRSAE